MTITAGRAITVPREDRRGRAAGPRVSWASPQPFVARRPLEAPVASWRRTAVRYRRSAVAIDAAVAGAVTAAVTWAVYAEPIIVLAASAASTLVFLALLWIVKGYEIGALGDGPGEYQAVLRAGAIGAFGLMAASYLGQLDLSRMLVLVGVPALVAGAVLARYAHRRLLHRARAAGRAMRRTVVVGDPADVRRVSRDLRSATYHGYAVEGVCLPEVGRVGEIDGLPVLGATADVVQLASDRSVEVVVVAGSALSGEGLRRLSWALGRVGSQLVVAPDLLEVARPRLSVRPTAGLSLLEVEVDPPRRRLLVKSVMDRVLSAVGLVVCVPVIAIAAIAVRADSPGPAFYRQTRVGVDGRTFTMWKLRTMYLDADARRTALLAQSDRDGVMFKMRADPRVTRVGRVLRRFSVDELPQVVNVLRGDMSLVGPRPPLVEEVEAYPDPAQRRLHVRPGLTGLWQVSGRADLTWEESVRLDLRYVDNWSVAMDLTILWKTVRAVLRGSGAY